MSVVSGSPRVVYAAAVERLAASVVCALGSVDGAFRLRDQLPGDQLAGPESMARLAAVRILGPDALAPFVLGGHRFRAEDAEVVAASLGVFPVATPDAPMDSQLEGPAGCLEGPVPVRALRDWATGQVLTRLGARGFARPYPRGAGTGRDRSWLRWAVLLAHLGGLRAARVAELLPNRALAVVNAHRTLGLPDRADIATLTARTWLGGTPEPWAVDFLTLYAMTHTVFHLTDWGAHTSGLPDHVQAYLHAWLPAWLEVYLEAGQWDLIAELLIVDLCLTEPDFYPHAWDYLAGAQHSDGLVPYGPVRVPREVAKAFRNHYHPTLVTTIAGTLAVSRRMAQASPVSSAAP